MKETRYYKVAGHRFCVTGEAEGFALMENYEPFAIQGDGAFVTSGGVTKEPSPCIVALSIGGGEAPEYTEDLRQ